MADENFEVRLDGRLTFTDPANQPGSGFQPARNVGQTELDFTGLAVNNTSVPIPFTFGDGDATMIDLSSPTTPLPVTAGIYAYTLRVAQVGGGNAGAFFTTLVVDDDYYSITVQAGHEPQSVGQGASGQVVALEATWFCTAGSPFHAAIANAVADTFSGNLYVQKLS